MRALFCILLLFAACESSIAADITFTATFDEDDFSFGSMMDYDIVSCQGGHYFGEVGAPQVLYKYLNFIIPRGETIESISIDQIESKEFPLTYALFPVQPEEFYGLYCNIEPPEWVEPDPKFYESDDPYPSDTVVFGGAGYLDGANNLARVMVFPAIYYPIEKLLIYHSSITFTLHTGGESSETPLFPQFRMKKDQQLTECILNNTIENPQDILAACRRTFL